MAKQKRGLPDGFELEIDESATKPADIADFVDAEIPPARPREATAPAPASTRSVAPAERPRPALRSVDSAAVAEAEAPARRRKPTRRPPRKEISLDAETQRMIQQLVDDIRTESAEEDARSSEFIRAVVQVAYDSRHHARFDNVRRRGQWGSPTARAFVADLKEVYLRSIGDLFTERYARED